MSDPASTTQSPQRGLEAIVLAAGKGTRMSGEAAKVLHPVADRAMVSWVLDACEQAGCRREVVVVGYRAEDVGEHLADRPDCVFAMQTEQLGTGHAVMVAAPQYADVDRERTDVLVLYGDAPLIRAETIHRLVQAHRQRDAAATLATAILDEPTGYGRIIRDEAGRFARIVEEKDATDEQRALREVNPGYYCFNAGALFEALGRIDNDNAKGEYYLTDALGILVGEGRPVEVVEAVPPEDVLSVNTDDQLQQVDRMMRERIASEVRG